MATFSQEFSELLPRKRIGYWHQLQQWKLRKRQGRAACPAVLMLSQLATAWERAAKRGEGRDEQTNLQELPLVCD